MGTEKGTLMENTSQAAVRVSKISILVNVFLTLAKLAAGILARSGAMISDAAHSASDVFSTVVVIIGVKLSGRASDKEHPYGHERMECVAAIILSVILLITGLAIGLVTPPVGMCLNACNKINGMPIIDIFKCALPYITCNILVLIAISVWEPLTTWLPTLLHYSLN